ncbi:perlucin-like protein [Acanthaster planci]|uniref:Perlucin-like protein n=1 Tax=Acanthaster planci TaxID=133434 RepID=A0A8B7YEB5_ACAPL|nr:perlucin-like protein [Acanthaster planci]
MKFTRVMIFALTVIILVVVAVGMDTCPSSITVQAPCPPSWQSWRHSCYRFTDEPANWDQSKLACQTMGGKMAAPYSQEENEVIVRMAQRQNINHLWIGCNDREKEGTWVCEGQGRGEPYFNWQPGEPNGHGTENCIEFYQPYYGGGSLNDNNCNILFRAICVRLRRQTSCLHCPIQPACGYQPHRARHYCFATDTDGQLLNSCLVDHVIRKFVTMSNPSCTSACIIEPACLSFNIKYNDEGQKICQLNNATHCDDPDNFQDIRSFCLYAQECVN